MDKILGFEDLAGGDAFKTSTLEKRLGQSGVIAKSGSGAAEPAGSLCGFAAKEAASDSDDD